MNTDSLSRWVDELQGQIDDLKRNTGNTPAPEPSPYYTRQSIVSGEEVTGDSSITIEASIPSNAKYLYVKLYSETGLTPIKQIRFSGIYDADDLIDGHICPSFNLIGNSPDDWYMMYAFKMSFASNIITVNPSVIVTEGYVPGTIKMDLIAFIDPNEVQTRSLLKTAAAKVTSAVKKKTTTRKTKSVKKEEK